MSITTERQIGRAKNAVLELLQRRLAVPRIYFEAVWDGIRVDVLAIDRDGVGDAHVVLVRPAYFFDDGKQNIVKEAHETSERLDRFRTINAQYKYIAIVHTRADHAPFRFGLSPELRERTFSADGLGRVGFIIIQTPDDAEARAELEIKPERFRAFIGKQADEFVRANEADWEVRPDFIPEESHA